MAKEVVKVPDIGSTDPVDVIEISVARGDTVAREDIILILESDKATVEVPSPLAGSVQQLLVAVGDRVREGDPLLELETGETGARKQDSDSANIDDVRGGDVAKLSSEEPDHAKTDEVIARKTAPAAPNNNPTGDDPQKAVSPAAAAAMPDQQAATAVYAGPAVRKLARSLGVDLAAVKGTGLRGRIQHEDVHEWARQRLQTAGTATSFPAASLPQIDFSKYGEIESVELSRIRKVSAANLHRSWITIPHVTQHDEADITDLELFRKAENRRLEARDIKLTMLAFLVKVCAVALRDFPDFNSSLDVDGERLILKKYIHIGIAVDTPGGLVVPVLQNADRKSLTEIAAEAADLAERARERKLKPAEMQGGTFSISSLGGIGGTAFTPVVNWPEVAILGVSRARTMPHWDGNNFVPRLMLPLSLSYDHRVIDGAAAARFASHLVTLLGDLRRVLV